eukprot:TRINITY_DN18721_c0_g1_i1.p1 TRINITY_DN18721_c0_g1~~TRINITY_DN18721_c0_g1_i1.p1  ORF type:complete len:412 (+),score=34.49 TRINITY_DN18721_c0_g1_i1:113-1348(+)
MASLSLGLKSAGNVCGVRCAQAVKRQQAHSVSECQLTVEVTRSQIHKSLSWSAACSTSGCTLRGDSGKRWLVAGQSPPSRTATHRNQRCRSLKSQSGVARSGLATDESESEVQGESRGKSIWLSDVVPTKQRPYFLGRTWNKKDITYGSYMLAVHGLCLFAPATFSWNAFALFAGLYIITGMLGITLSFHRNLSHKSFKLPKWLEYTFAYCGVQAIQGPPLEWVSAHRFHHAHCDTEKDPHSPYEGFWHSHMGWLLDNETTDARVGKRSNIADLENDPFYNWIEKTYPFHPIGMAVLLYALGGFPYLVWGVAVRAVWVYHITWFVNSASHVWGNQKWNTGDLSRNNWWVAILAFGEGWHNNHHAFEYSARHGLEWWQVDMTWYVVRALEAVGLAKNVRLPRQDHMNKLAMK